MAVISGFLATVADSGHDNPYLSDDLYDYTDAWIDAIVYWEAMPSPGAEPMTTHWPVSTTPYAKSGAIVLSYFDDYYNRIHIAPRVLDIGNLLSVQTRQATVWNAYLTGKLLSAINEEGTTGLTESGITAPTTFAPLEERTYAVTVDTIGPATIDATYHFVFPAESPSLRVTGRRVVVFGHPPNWAEPVRERLNWLTDVLTSQAGVEQRIGLRAAPRRAIEYSLASLDRHQTNRLETLLLGWQSRLFAVPVWTDMQRLAAQVTAGDSVIPCDTTGYEFTEGGLALLWRAHDDWEVVEISAPAEGMLLLAGELLNTWPAGTRLYPIRLGRMPDRQSLTRATGHHVSGRVAFEIEDNPGVTPEDIGDIYAGYRVYLGRTNWAQPTEVEALRQIEVLDYDTGSRWVDDLSGLATLLKSWHWLLPTRLDIVALRGWLAARGGRLVPFWSATQAVDLEVIAAIGASDTAITVRNVGYTQFISARADRRHLVIETVAGTRHYRRITGSSEIDDAGETLGIDSALGVTLQPADIRSVRFLHLVRLDSDEIEIEWHTLGVAECSTMLRSLPS